MDPKEDESSSKELNIPNEHKIISLILRSQGVEDCDSNVTNLLLEYAKRYTEDVLKDALIYSEYAGKNEIDNDDIQLAIQGRTSYSFSSPPDPQFYLQLSKEVNKTPLPLISEKFGLRLPSEKHTLTGVNFQVVPHLGIMKFE
ncbi:hypothetical protein BB560_003771, partial [Smittium megazygosporum]